MAANDGARSVIGIDLQGSRSRRFRRLVCGARPPFARGNRKTAAGFRSSFHYRRYGRAAEQRWLFAATLKDTPSVLSVVLGDGANTTVQEKAGFAFAGDDPRPFLLGFKGAS